jgi:membrane fusion protein, multidrug efflux system
MRKRNQIILISAVVVTAIMTLLFINKSRLDASTERISTKPSVVSVARASRQPVPLQINAIGVLQAYNDVPVIAETQGKVLKRYIDVGDYVRAGDPMVKVDTLLKYAAFVTAKTAYKKADSDLTRFKALHEQGNLSNNELELATLNFRSAEAQYLVAKRQYEDAIICAPISGEIAERMVDVGMLVAPGDPVATIVDIVHMKVTIAVAENKISRIKKGMQVSVNAEAYPEKIFTGTVKYIGPKASESLLFPVEIVISNNHQYPLKAGMTAHISFNQAATSDALLIPRIALLGSAREGKVYVVNNNIAHIRPVAVGNEFGSNVEIISGIQEGEIVVTVGTNTIRDNAPVTVLQ